MTKREPKPPERKRRVAAEDASAALARENWRRIRALFEWMGREDDDDDVLRLIRLHAPGAPRDPIKDARNGKNGAEMRVGSARALVGPLLGLEYDHERGEPDAVLEATTTSTLAEYAGPAPADLIKHLREDLSPQQHFDLVEHWVKYVRGARLDPPHPWRPPSAPAHAPPPSETTASQGIADREAPQPTAPPTSPVAPPRETSRRWLLPAGVLGAGALGAILFLLLKPATPPPPAASKDDPTAQVQKASPPTPLPTLAPPPSAPTELLRVTMEAERAGVPLQITGRPLQHEDRIAFQVEVTEPLYAFLFQLGDDGRVTTLYPQGPALLLEPGVRRRIPNPREGAFELDSKAGEERLLLVGASHPIPRDPATITRLLQPLAKHADWPKHWPVPSAGAAGPKTRGAKPRGGFKVTTRNVVFVRNNARSGPGATPVIVTAQFLSFDHQG